MAGSQIHFEYAGDTLTRLLFTPDGARPPFTEWMEWTLSQDRLETIRDSYGRRISLRYDPDGRLAGIDDSDGEQLRIHRDASGTMTGWSTGGGVELTGAGDATGYLAGLELTRDGKRSTVRFRDGRIRQLVRFDGGTYDFDYDDQVRTAGFEPPPAAASRPRLRSIRTPSGLELGLGTTRRDDSGR